MNRFASEASGRDDHFCRPRSRMDVAFVRLATLAATRVTHCRALPLRAANSSFDRTGMHRYVASFCQSLRPPSTNNGRRDLPSLSRTESLSMSIPCGAGSGNSRSQCARRKSTLGLNKHFYLTGFRHHIEREVGRSGVPEGIANEVFDGSNKVETA